MEKKKKSIILLVFFGLFIIAWFVIAQFQPKQEEYNRPSPEEVVRLYFTSWNDNNYPDMYSTISDGFKRIEPTAKNLDAFKAYISSLKIKAVDIVNIQEASNDGTIAIVDYTVEFTTEDGEKIPSKNEFTLKNKEGDIIQGWKLIHPYGDYSDMT